jgi:hypothetical protein
MLVNARPPANVAGSGLVIHATPYSRPEAPGIANPSERRRLACANALGAMTLCHQRGAPWRRPFLSVCVQRDI